MASVVRDIILVLYDLQVEACNSASDILVCRQKLLQRRMKRFWLDDNLLLLVFSCGSWLDNVVCKPPPVCTEVVVYEAGWDVHTPFWTHKRRDGLYW
jgi:hypothetical protein